MNDGEKVSLYIAFFLVILSNKELTSAAFFDVDAYMGTSTGSMAPKFVFLPASRSQTINNRGREGIGEF